MFFDKNTYMTLHGFKMFYTKRINLPKFREMFRTLKAKKCSKCEIVLQNQKSSQKVLSEIRTG